MGVVTRFWAYAAATVALTSVTILTAARWYAETYESGEGDDSLAPLAGIFFGAGALLLCLLIILVIELGHRAKSRRRQPEAAPTPSPRRRWRS